MREGGHKLAIVRDALGAAVRPGVTPLEIEELANKLIAQEGATAAFKEVEDYHHATCINVNSVIVHGIPNSVPFKKGDMVSIDVGLKFNGFYTDTTICVVAGEATEEQKHFISVGYDALKAGIQAAKAGNRVSDVSRAIETVLRSNGYSVVEELTGHGVGRELHEDPAIPNFVDRRLPDPILHEGQTIAIEPMYTAGKRYIKIDRDGWTIRTVDGSLAGLVEDTIVITKDGGLVLTQ